VKSVSGAANIKLIRALGNLPVTIGFLAIKRARWKLVAVAGLLGRSVAHFIAWEAPSREANKFGTAVEAGRGADHSARKLKCSWLCFLIAAQVSSRWFLNLSGNWFFSCDFFSKHEGYLSTISYRKGNSFQSVRRAGKHSALGREGRDDA